MKSKRAWEVQMMGSMTKCKKKWPYHGKKKNKDAHQSIKKGQIKEIQQKRKRLKDTMSQVNDSDPKSLKLWNSLWTYESLSFITCIMCL